MKKLSRGVGLLDIVLETETRQLLFEKGLEMVLKFVSSYSLHSFILSL